MIYFAKNIEVELIKSTIDNEGRYIVLDCKIQGTRFLLYSIYAPNNKEEHKHFLTTIKDLVCNKADSEIQYKISAGDWNFTEDNIDRLGGNYTIWKENVQILKEINEKTDSIDIWRVRNPEKKTVYLETKKTSHTLSNRQNLHIRHTTIQRVKN